MPLVRAEDRCLSLVNPVREATYKYIANDFPYWYNVGLAKKETNCRWIKSLDGHGSVGYFQLTPKFLDTYLKPLFPDYTKEYSKDHFYAFAYYLKSLINKCPVKKLWVVYQMYNGGNWVLNECKKAGIWEWEKCKNQCKRGMVCVWKTNEGCKQYRSACDINYMYSVKVYQFGQAYKTKPDAYFYW